MIRLNVYTCSNFCPTNPILRININLLDSVQKEYCHGDPRLSIDVAYSYSNYYKILFRSPFNSVSMAIMTPSS